MKKIASILAAWLVAHSSLQAQQMPSMTVPPVKKHHAGIGLKAGYNYAHLAGTSPSFNLGPQKGFMASAFFAPASHGLGYRTEIVYSRQGFSFDDNNKMQNVQQDYLYMPHLTTYTIANVVQLQAGGQIGYLLNAKSTSNGGSSNSVASYMNRIDYGFAFGLEVYPFKGLLIGGRYNISEGNMYKNTNYASGMPSPFPYDLSQFKGRNAVVQLFAGYRF